MSIKVSQNGASVNKPGTYPAVKVQNLTGFPLQPTGIVAIAGEAAGGKPGVLDVLEGTAIQTAKSRYKSGPIADALGLLVNPSKDPRVQNGASKIIVFKVNPSTQATKTLLNNDSVPLSFATLTSKNWGIDENNVGVRALAGSILDANAFVLGTVDGPFTLAGGETLILKANGTTYTYTGALTGSTSAAALAASLNTGGNWSAAKPVIATAVGNKIRIEIDPAVVLLSKLEYGYLWVNPTSTLDTIVGITGSNRGIRGTRLVGFKKSTLIEDAIPEIGGQSVITVRYTGAGTDCKLTIQNSLGNRVLTTACTAAPLDNLSIILGYTEDSVMVSKMTISDLVDQINANASYTASVSYTSGSLSVLELDFYNAVNIELVDFKMHRDAEDLVQKVTSLSTLASAERLSTATGQLALISAYEYLSGAVVGVATNANWSAAFEAFKEVRAELVIPLISQDVGAVTIDTVNALADAHAVWSWGANGKSPRQTYVSKLGSKAQLKSAAQTLNSGYTSIFGQDVKVFSHSYQELKWLEPWAQACVAGGIKAGSTVGEPTTFKFVNVNDIRTRDGSWNPRVDVTEMIDAGVTFFEAVDSGGFRVVVGNTTYSSDASFVWNRDSVVEAAAFVYYDLMINLELIFTGTKARTGTAEGIANMIKARMEVYLTADIIVGDLNNDSLGYMDLRVQLGGAGIGGNTAVIDVTITPVQGVDFILPTIFLADIRQSA